MNNEDYSTIQICLKEIIENLEGFNSVTINGIVFRLVFTLGGDLPWLANITGINAANADFPCIWCKWNKKEDGDIRRSWTINDRSHQEAEENLHLFGYKNFPLFRDIPFENTVVDTLHLLLRITDVLLEKLLNHIMFFDTNNREMIFFNRLKTFFEVECKITNPFYISRKGITKFRSMNGNERIKILESFSKKNLKQIFQEKKDDNKLILINYIFLKFNELYNKFINNYSTVTYQFNKDEYESNLREFLEFYLRFINYSNISTGRKKGEIEYMTPYVHIFIFHTSEFIMKYKNVNMYSTESLEKSNDFSKQYLMRQTNKKDIKQILEKHNRIEFIKLKGTTAELYEQIDQA